MHFGPIAVINKSQKPVLQINNTRLTVTNTYRYLGMTLDSQLNFKEHTKTLLKSVNFKTYLFRRTRIELTDASALDVLISLILPVIDYGDIIYGVTTKTLMNQLQSAFERGLKTAYYMDEDRRNVPKLMSKAKVNILSDRRQMHLNTAAFNISSIENNIDIRDIRTRAHDGKLLKVIWPKDPFYRKSLEYRLPTVWNALETDTRNIALKVTFQTWNKKFFLDKCAVVP